MVYRKNSLKLVSAKFVLVCFLRLKESTNETSKNASYFKSSFRSQENQSLEF